MGNTSRSTSRWHAATALCLLTGAVVAPAAAVPQDEGDRDRHPQVRIIDLGVVAGGTAGSGDEAVATRISESGVVYGYVGGLEPSRAFRWEDGDVTWLDRLGHDRAGVVEVNDRGDAAGVVADGDPDGRPESTRVVVWTQDGRAVLLGEEGTDSFPVDINNRRVVAGVSGSQAVVWQRDGRMVVLDNPQDGVSEATAINDRGQVAGMVSDAERTQTAARWDQNGQISVFQAPVAATRRSVAVDINRRGEVLVWTFSFDDERVDRWYVWGRGGDVTELPIDLAQIGTQFWGPRGDVYGARADEATGFGVRAVRVDDGEVVDLGVLSGGDSVVTAANRRGQAVGGATLADLLPGGSVAQRAVLFEDRRVVDLGTLPGGRWSFAYDINERGQVVGTSWGGDENGFSHAVMWETRR